MSDHSAPKFNAAIFQPALPKYRIPMFRQLNQSCRIKVFFGSEKHLSNDSTAAFENCPIKEWNIKLPGGKTALWSWRQIGVCGDASWDVVVLPWNIGYLSLVPSLLRARFNGIGTILWGHGYSKSSGWFRTAVRNWITNLATAVLFYDPVTKTKFQDLTGRENCFVAANAIDSAPIEKQIIAWGGGSRLEDFQSEHGIADRDVLLFVSRFDPNNRLDLLIRALPMIRSKRDSVLLVFVGGGPDEEKLRSLVAELDCQENVRFTGPIYEEENLAPWFLSSRLFCYPTNIGLSLMHAFNYGLPVVLGDDFSRCNPEIYAFEEGTNGVVFKDGNAESLAAEILNLLSDPKSLERLSVGAKKTATTVTTPQRFVDGYRQAIEFAAVSTKRSRT